MRNWHALVILLAGMVYKKIPGSRDPTSLGRFQRSFCLDFGGFIILACVRDRSLNPRGRSLRQSGVWWATGRKDNPVLEKRSKVKFHAGPAGCLSRGNTRRNCDAA